MGLLLKRSDSSRACSRTLSDDLELRVGLYSLPGLPRSEDTAGYISSRYYPLERLFGMQADAVIVTGTEPLAEHLTAEPYWEALTGLINWAAESTVSAVLSCLAAHAAVLLFDGIEREPLAEKCSGVFSHEVVTSHALVEGMAGPIFVPHSRLNDVPYRSLSEHGYTSFLSSHESRLDRACTRARQLSLHVRPGPPRVLDLEPIAGVPARSASVHPRRT